MENSIAISKTFLILVRVYSYGVEKSVKQII